MVWSSFSWGEGVNVSKLVCSGVSASRPPITEGVEGAPVGARNEGPSLVDGGASEGADPVAAAGDPVAVRSVVAAPAGATAGSAASTDAAASVAAGVDRTDAGADERWTAGAATGGPTSTMARATTPAMTSPALAM